MFEESKILLRFSKVLRKGAKNGTFLPHISPIIAVKRTKNLTKLRSVSLLLLLALATILASIQYPVWAAREVSAVEIQSVGYGDFDGIGGENDIYLTGYVLLSGESNGPHDVVHLQLVLDTPSGSHFVFVDNVKIGQNEFQFSVEVYNVATEPGFYEVTLRVAIAASQIVTTVIFDPNGGSNGPPGCRFEYF